MATTTNDESLEIDNILKGEESLLTREQEVERVVAAFKLNPYEILDLDMTKPTSVTDSIIRKTYRQKSLLIHPDKLTHPRGVEAFDLLKKAEGFLLDPEKRKGLDETIKDARMLTLRRLNLPDSTPDEHEKLATLNPSFQFRVALKTKEIIIEEELRVRRARKMTMIAEGTEAKRHEDAIAKRKRELEEKKRWEETREERVTDWRSFQKGETSGKKKKKQKLEVLG
ncbi:hypothetical protein PTTG_07979 [Puccinia triticina 1-1 BBBD Race 1]|uniref:J domain-containing protein n=2 Tax=Puccinia triticina TaxID=208348 RepID=A0A180GJB7_PUCT1|nr:uncharacterized protein PtA15_8A112 [Puccinia triticina]OAV92422.1 hypothetical protein PTTG_07979 [Puccinia triticina 1-1 BBBD Race 1]WAQ87211.1 hypothetical protein PtA15_8A112 [Puccinia triticina]WAR57059.1 hypothetical protein PtB15_8B103 [Puccinia triticina]